MVKRFLAAFIFFWAASSSFADTRQLYVETFDTAETINRLDTSAQSLVNGISISSGELLLTGAVTGVRTTAADTFIRGIVMDSDFAPGDTLLFEWGRVVVDPTVSGKHIIAYLIDTGGVLSPGPRFGFIINPSEPAPVTNKLRWKYRDNGTDAPQADFTAIDPGALYRVRVYVEYEKRQTDSSVQTRHYIQYIDSTGDTVVNVNAQSNRWPTTDSGAGAIVALEMGLTADFIASSTVHTDSWSVMLIKGMAASPSVAGSSQMNRRRLAAAREVLSGNPAFDRLVEP